MEELSFTESIEPDVSQIEKKISGPGIVFGEPLREGNHTIIPVVKNITRRGKAVVRPVAVIVVTGETVKLHRLGANPFAVALLAFVMTGLIGTCAALLFPPWRPGESLLGSVGKLIQTLRERSGDSCCDC